MCWVSIEEEVGLGPGFCVTRQSLLRCGPVFLISVLVLQDGPKKRFSLEGTAGSCRMGALCS